jgi:hypothetical protein
VGREQASASGPLEPGDMSLAGWTRVDVTTYFSSTSTLLPSASCQSCWNDSDMFSHTTPSTLFISGARIKAVLSSRTSVACYTPEAHVFSAVRNPFTVCPALACVLASAHHLKILLCRRPSSVVTSTPTSSNFTP